MKDKGYQFFFISGFLFQVFCFLYLSCSLGRSYGNLEKKKVLVRGINEGKEQDIVYEEKLKGWMLCGVERFGQGGVQLLRGRLNISNMREERGVCN